MNYIEPRLVHLAMPHALCPMPSGPLHLNKAGKWARFGRTQRMSAELAVQDKKSGARIQDLGGTRGIVEDWNNGVKSKKRFHYNPLRSTVCSYKPIIPTFHHSMVPK